MPPVFWIFDGIGVKWTYKKIFILAFFIIPVTVFLTKKLLLKQSLSDDERTILRVVSIFFLCIAGSLIVMCVLKVKPLANPEYIRWFAFYYFAILASLFLIFLANLLLKKQNGYAKVAFFLICFSLVLFNVKYVKDFHMIGQWVKYGSISFQEMQNLQTVLNKLTKKNKCYLITESRQGGHAWIGGRHTMQTYKPLDYFAVISDCKILNGSWVTSPLKQSREIENMPAAQFYTDNILHVYFMISSKFSISIE